jgi:hypothetical protein
MSLENWASNKWLERLASDREEIERLLANVDGHLADYHKAVASDTSAYAQLSLAYDDYGLVAQGEADLAGKLAVRVRKEVEDWIRKNHADTIA